MAVSTKIGEFAEKLLYEIGAEWVVGGRNRMPSSETKQTPEQFKRKGLEDNSSFRKLLATAGRRFGTKGRPINFENILSKFLDYLITKADPRVRKSLEQRAERAIEAGLSSTISHLNTEAQIRRFLAIPLIEHFGEMARTELPRAEEALKSFCEKSWEDMASDYEVFASQPDSMLDKFLIAWKQTQGIWAERQTQAKENVARAEAPGGILFKLKYGL